MKQAVDDTARIIRGSGQKAKVYRSGAARSSVNGRVAGALVLVASDIPIELDFLTPKDLQAIGASAVASVLPDANVQENDIIEESGIKYKATEVKPIRHEGLTTHLFMHLEKEEATVV